MRFAIPSLVLVLSLSAAHGAAQPDPEAQPSTEAQPSPEAQPGLEEQPAPVASPAPAARPVYQAPPAAAAPPVYQPQPLVVAPPAHPEPKARDIVVAYNKGLRFGIAPGIMIDPTSGDIGFSIAGDVRYGFDLGALVLAPGIRLAGYFPPDRIILIGLATLRLTFPVGPVGPFVVGGAGPGWVNDPSQVGIAYLAGGGFMVHIGTRLGFGAEVNYQAITDTDFGALSFGPLFLLSF